MILPLSQLINALHSLKNSATASIQTLHKDTAAETSSFLKEVTQSQRGFPLCPSNHIRTFSDTAETRYHDRMIRNSLCEVSEPCGMCLCVSLAHSESEGAGSVRAQGESAGRAGQQVTAPPRTRGASCCSCCSLCSLCVEDQSRFCRQLLPEQAR